MKTKNLLFLFLFFVIILLIGSIIGSYYLFFDKPSSNNNNNNNNGKNNNNNNQTKTPVNNIDCKKLKDSFSLPNFEDAKQKLSSHPLILATPKDSKIVIKFFHFIDNNYNCRKIDKTFLLKAGTIEETSIAPDIEIMLATKYVEEINSDNLCDVIKLAKKNGDLGVTTSVSKPKLLWTYSGLLKYKDCLGM